MQHHQCIFALISLDEYAIWAQRQILIKSGQLFRWEDTMETHFYILQRLSEPHVWHHDRNSSLYPRSWVVTASSAGTFLPGNDSSGCLTKRTVVAVWAACICGVNCMYLAPDGDIREHVWRLGVFGGQRPSVCVSVFLQRQTVWARGESLTQRRYYMKIDMKVV